jgi:D-lactate dehydrogenase (cytochrome)
MTAVVSTHEQCINELRALLGERLSTSESVLSQHGRDESSFPERLPQAVAFPSSTEDVAAIVRVCVRHGTPVVPFGAGTSLEGHVLPTRGGVTVNLSRMERVLAVNVADMDVRVQPGVRRVALNEQLARHGLFFPVDPGADATLGGMAATGASGTMSVRYGTMRENVLALEVVLANGEIVRTGTRARKSAAGYDLTHLFIGAEGTLGIITELTLRVRGIPRAHRGGGLLAAEYGGRRRERHRDRPARHPGRALRVPGRADDGDRQPPRRPERAGSADPLLRVPR